MLDQADKILSELSGLTDAEFVREFRVAVRRERHAIVSTCCFINELERRRCYGELGSPSAFFYLTRVEGFSEGTANSRIQAARYLRVIPQAAEQIASGALSVEAIATVQRSVRETEKLTGTKVSTELKADLLNRALHKTATEIQKLVAEALPHAAPARDIVQVRNEVEVRAHITLTREQLDKLERLKELLSHKLPSASLADVIEAAADELLSRKDPEARPVRARQKRTPEAISPADRNAVLRRDKGECQAEIRPGEKCRSRYQVQIDHIIPRTHGGSSLHDNLRCLCRHHNFQAAEVAFGRRHMARFLRGP